MNFTGQKWRVLVVVLALFPVLVLPAHSQDQQRSFDVYVESVTRLVTGERRIILWGVEELRYEGEILNLKGRVVLEQNIGFEPIVCVIKSETQSFLEGQCVNEKEQDISLLLLQQGYVSADRVAIKGTLFEKPYLDAESSAREAGRGIWGSDRDDRDSVNFVQTGQLLWVALGLVCLFMVGLGGLIFLMISGFKRVLELQNKSLNLVGKEQDLRGREKSVVATMIYSELNENQEKVQAYLTIHEDMLRNIKVTKTQKMGDIIQKQPSLSRSVFDGNTNKLDLFGERLASEIIHYYARIKTRPDYVEITAETPLKDVEKMIEESIENADHLRALCGKLMDSFVQHALVKSVH